MICLSGYAKVPEQSSAVIRADFREQGIPITAEALNSVTWTLTDEKGTVINSRTAIPITPASTVYVVCEADDLKRSEGATRVVLVEASYNSVLYGDGILLKRQASFELEDMAAVTE